jgi:hypothetical protein
MGVLKEDSMKARQVRKACAQTNRRSDRDMSAERILDALIATGRYHGQGDQLDVDRLVSGVRRLQTAMALTRLGQGGCRG